MHRGRSGAGSADDRVDQTPVTPAVEGRQVTLGRFEELEAYRGVAALLMVIFHAYQYSREGQGLEGYVYEGTWLHAVFSNLEVAVDWFFVLSGFLIFLPFAHAAVNREGRQSARGFLVRRAIRIVPLYYVAIILVWTLRYSGEEGEWVNLIQHLTFTQVFSREHIFWTIGPAWSLSVEVIFYLFVAVFGPLAYLVCGRQFAARTRLALLAGVISALAVTSVLYKGWAFYVARFPEENWPVYFGPLAKMDTFAIGMLLALMVVMSGTRFRLAGAVPLLLRIAAVLVLAALFALGPRSPLVELYAHTLSGTAFALVLASTVLVKDPMRRFAWARVLARPGFQWLGLISYSVYIWHEPLMLWLAGTGLFVDPAPEAFPRNALVLCAASIAAAALSYRAIERPAMNLRHLFTREGRFAKRYPE